MHRDAFSSGRCSLRLLLAIAACAALQASAALLHPDELKTVKDVPYLGAGRREKLDVYLPPDTFARPLPAVIWIHGGGWVQGDKASPREREVAATLAQNGYVTFSINYKLGRNSKDAPADPPVSLDPPPQAPFAAAPSDAEVPWPQNIADCKSALRYVRKEAARFGVDPNHIAVAGGSAGGHLALITGLSADAPELNKLGLYAGESGKVDCIVDFYGPTEFLIARRIELLSGATPEETERNVRAATPATYLAPDSPPILVVHGDADTQVAIGSSRRFVEALDKLGIPNQFVVVPKAPHAFDLEPKQMDLRPTVLAFLRKYLGQPQP